MITRFLYGKAELADVAWLLAGLFLLKAIP